MKELTGKQKRHLKGLGHPLKPLFQIGKSGVTDALIQEMLSALETHELMKVKVNQNAPDEIKGFVGELAEKLECQIAQIIGKTALLYKAREKDPAIIIPQ